MRWDQVRNWFFHRRPNKYTIFAVSFAALLAIMQTWQYITQPGYIYLAEQFEVYTVSDFWRITSRIWQPTTQEFPIADLPKLYVYAFFTIVGRLSRSYKLLQTTALISPIFIGFLTTYTLTIYTIKHSLTEISQEWMYRAALIAGTLAVINPWFVMNPRNLMFRVQYAFYPLLVYYTLRILRQKDYRAIGALALILGIVAHYRLFLIFGITVGLLLITNTLLNGYTQLRNSLRADLHIIAAGLLSVAIAAARLLPPLLYTMYQPPAATQSFSGSMIQREPLLHIFTTKIYTWTAVGYEYVYTGHLHFVFLFVTITAITSLLWVDRQKNISLTQVAPAVLVCGFIPLAASGVNLDWLLLDLPKAAYFGRLLRHARWNVLPVVTAICVLGGTATARIQRWRPPAALILAVLLVSTAFISAWPAATGDMNDYWSPTPLPDHYEEANIKLERATTERPNAHTVWFPENLRKAKWVAQSGVRPISAPTGILPLRSSPTPSYRTSTRYYFDYYRPLQNGYSVGPQSPYAGNLSRVYAPLNIQYLGLPSDGQWSPQDRARGFTNSYIRTQASKLNSRGWTTSIYRSRNLSVYHLQNRGREISLRQPVTVSGGLPVYGSLAHVVGNGTLPAIQFRYATQKPRPAQRVRVHRLGTGRLPRSTTLVPVVDSARAADNWSITTVESTDWQTRLANHGLNWSWQYASGGGIAVSRSPDWTSDADRQPPTVASWAFSTEAERQRWRSVSTQPPSQSYTHSPDALTALITNRSTGWRILRSPRVNISSKSVYRFESTLSGEDAHKVHVKVVERAANGSTLMRTRVGTIGDGTFTNASFSQIYVPRHENTASLQLEFWHGSNTSKPLPNRVHIKSVHIENVTTSASTSELPITTTTDEPGQYSVYARVFESQAGGELTVELPNQRWNIDTRSSQSRFVWKRLGTVRLDGGEETATIRNHLGFNAVDALALARTGGNKTPSMESILIGEAERDFTLRNGRVVTNQNASNGKYIQLSRNGTLTETVTVPKRSKYRVRIDGQGRYQIQIGNTTRIISSSNETAITSMIIPAGRNRVTITSAQESVETPTMTIDRVWISSSQNQSIPSLLTGSTKIQSQIKSISQPTSTTYEVDVQTSSSTIMTVAEGYDALWTATAYTDNSSYELSPRKYYGTIFGFKIPAETERVVVTYRPRDWYQDARLISLFAVFVAVGLIGLGRYKNLRYYSR